MTIPLAKNHDRANFDCGVEALNLYLKQKAGQDVKRNLSACFILSPDPESKEIVGFYTLSSGSVSSGNFSAQIQKQFGRAYADLPVTLLGRLAVDVSWKGRGLGKVLLMDALKRCWMTREWVASFAVVVDPKDEDAAAFYEVFGFVALQDSKRMFIAMRTLDPLFKK